MIFRAIIFYNFDLIKKFCQDAVSPTGGGQLAGTMMDNERGLFDLEHDGQDGPLRLQLGGRAGLPARGLAHGPEGFLV